MCLMTSCFQCGLLEVSPFTIWKERLHVELVFADMIALAAQLCWHNANISVTDLTRSNSLTRAMS